MLLDLLLKAETQTMMFLNTMKWFVKSLNLIKPLNIRALTERRIPLKLVLRNVKTASVWLNPSNTFNEIEHVVIKSL